jgi:tetrahydromethanopterin S-methyltransferase subunit E
MSDEFVDGYIVGSVTNDNNNNGFGAGIAIALFVFLYPYMPFMIVGYEMGNSVGNAVNIAKWGGTIVGFVFGLIWYHGLFRALMSKWLGIESGFAYWFIAYLFGSLLFWILGFVYPENTAVRDVLNLWGNFFRWAMRAS